MARTKQVSRMTNAHVEFPNGKPLATKALRISTMSTLKTKSSPPVPKSIKKKKPNEKFRFRELIKAYKQTIERDASDLLPTAPFLRLVHATCLDLFPRN